MGQATTYRTCPRSGLQFEAQAEKLMIFNAVAGVLFLAFGGLLAIGVVLTRWPAVHWLEADTFYMVLTAHGLDMLIFWLIFFEIAILYFCASTLLRCRIATPRLAWLAFALMVIGSVGNNIVVFQGSSSVMMTSYVPMMASSWFYLTIILFAVGALIGCGVFFGTLVVARRDRTYEGSVPLVTMGAITAAIIAVFTLLSGAIILVPTWLMSIGLIKQVDPLAYRTIWWALGHSSQQINVAAHISVWYLVAAVVFGAKPMSERVSRTAFLLYILFLQLASAHHLLADPGLSTPWKIVNTSYFMYFAVLASMLHGLTVPGAMEVAQRQKGFTKGLFEWLRKAPWGNPTFSGMLLAYDWPGNVRELQNFCKSITIKEPEITNSVITQHLRNKINMQRNGGNDGMERFLAIPNIRESTAAFEREYLVHFLEENAWQVSKTAAAIGIERTTLYKKMKQLGIVPEEEL